MLLKILQRTGQPSLPESSNYLSQNVHIEKPRSKSSLSKVPGGVLELTEHGGDLPLEGFRIIRK